MTTRNQRADIDDRWTKRVKNPDGTMSTERSAVYGQVTRWRVRWVDAEQREHSKSFRLKTDAQGFLNGLNADVQRGDYIDPRKAGETFGPVAEAWFLTKQGALKKPKTLAGYRSLLDTIVLPRWGEVPLNRIDYAAYSQWLGLLATEGSQTGKGLSASRITQAHQLVGAVLKYAQKTGQVSKNVALEFKRGQDIPEQPERERRYLTHAELLQLAAATGRFETLTLVLGYCGLRFGEAAALRRRHVGDRELTISASATHVTGRGIVESTTKTKRARHVPVPGPVWDLLSSALPDEPNALVFPRLRGGLLPIEEYRRAFDKACAEVGIVGLTPHGLRHTCASLAISAGANVKVVQRLLGHATAAMTLDLYGHLMDDDLAEVANVLSKAIETTAVLLRHSEQSGTKARLLETKS
jgi:integrase